MRSTTDLELHAALRRGGRCDERHARKRTRTTRHVRVQRAGGADRRHAPFPNAGPKVERTTAAGYTADRRHHSTYETHRRARHAAFGERHAPVSVRARLAHEPTASEDAARRWRNRDARTGRYADAERTAATSEHVREPERCATAARYRRKRTDRRAVRAAPPFTRCTSHAVSILYEHGGEPIDDVRPCATTRARARGRVCHARVHATAGPVLAAGRLQARRRARRDTNRAAARSATRRCHARTPPEVDGARYRHSASAGTSAAYESRTPRRGEPDAHRVGPRPRGLRAEG